MPRDSSVSEMINFNVPEIFYEKGYGIELYHILKINQSTIGLTELYESIHSPKPLYAAFRRYVDKLHMNGLVELRTSSRKKSKTIIRLTPNI